jgi:hypothetical protein
MPELLHQDEDEPTEDDPTRPDSAGTDEGDAAPDGGETNGVSRASADLRSDGGVTAASVDATFEIPTDVGTARMTVPETATRDEAAAVAAAVAAHVDEEEAEAEPEEADRWTLARCLGCRRPTELPRTCPRGDEWKASARASW